MTKTIHPVAGTVAILVISCFWLSTVLVELFGDLSLVARVKAAIPWGFLLLIPALAATGASGFRLAAGRRGGLIGTKMKRMPFIAANGILVLVPAAFYLSHKAGAGEFDTMFYIVQALELLAGACNFTLLALNMRDGFKMTGRFRRQGKRAG